MKYRIVGLGLNLSDIEKINNSPFLSAWMTSDIPTVTLFRWDAC